MKVVFLDFDGVLNSDASFLAYERVKNARGLKMPVNHSLCNVCCSNFQLLLEKEPDAKIVISSTWRILFDLDWLKDKLAAHYIDPTRIIGVTPSLTFPGRTRGDEIQAWLDAHPEVTRIVILDDNSDMKHLRPWLVQTNEKVGMLFDHVDEALDILRSGNENDFRA